MISCCLYRIRDYVLIFLGDCSRNTKAPKFKTSEFVDAYQGWQECLTYLIEIKHLYIIKYKLDLIRPFKGDITITGVSKTLLI